MKHVPSPSAETQLLGLSLLMQLSKRARLVEGERELAFVMVNETHALTPYRQAVLWRSDPRGGGKIMALSGIATVERNAPQVLWLNRVLSHLASQENAAPVCVEAADLPDTLGAPWSEWLPAYGLVIPLKARTGEQLGLLLLSRDKPWGQGEQQVLQELAEAYGHAWMSLSSGRRRMVGGRLRARPLVKLVAAAVILGALWIPVPLTVLAPAEVIALNPTIVRAPLDGVVDRFLVQPNEPVRQGQPILELDARAIQNKLDVATQELAVAEAEYRQAAQEALFDDKSRVKLAVLKGRMDQRRFDMNYAKSLLERIHVTAAHDGLALFDDPNEWIGRPVTIGERLMVIANPNQALLEIWLPVADAIKLTPDAQVEFFLNVSPEHPLHATLVQANYEATLSPANLLGYRLRAKFDDGAALPRIGLRGTTKLYGERVSLFYYLARRPLAALRQFLGW